MLRALLMSPTSAWAKAMSESAVVQFLLFSVIASAATKALAIVECEYAYILRCRLCGGMGLVDVIAKPGWRAHITEMKYDSELGPLVSLIGKQDDL